MTIDKTINIVTENGICCGCGTCESICPKDCITFSITKAGQIEPCIDQDKCTNCGLCFKVCPNTSYNLQPTIKPPLEVYSGYSKKPKLRFDAASGGIVTQILIDGLTSKKFDAVVVVSGNIPADFRAIIATTPNELINAKGSKYLQVPVNKILKELDNSSYKKIAYVGLPCHIRGLEKYLSLKKSMAKKIIFKLTLVCGQTLKHTAISRQLKALKIDTNQLKKYTFRGNGWPGSQNIQSTSTQIQLPHTSRKAMGGLFASPLCSSNACLFCEDHFGKNADLSFCDTWHSPEKGKCTGLTSALCYSLKGKDFIEEMIQSSKNLEMEKDNFKNILTAQGHMKSTGSRVYILQKKLKNHKIKITSTVPIRIQSIIAAIIYQSFISIFSSIELRHYPMSLLSMTRHIKRLLKY